MKIRTDFVTNSSSSSFIAVFAKISDEEKAKSVLDKYNNIEVYTADEVIKEMERSRWSSWLEYDWAGVDVTPEKQYVEENINSKFVVVTDSFDIDENDGEPDYDIDFEEFDADTKASIEAINEENGFVDIECQYGAGRNG